MNAILRVAFLLFLLVVVLADVGFAQFELNYTPRKHSSSASHELLEFITRQINKEFSETYFKDNLPIDAIKKERIEELSEKVTAGLFVQDSSLERFPNQVLKNIAETNDLKRHDRRVLVARSGQLNAYCAGQGIYVVTTESLARIKTEDELAFAIAHEMAHDELSHIKQSILQQWNLSLKQKSKKFVKDLILGNLNLENLDEFRQLAYSFQRYSRKKETQADSMAFVMMAKAGYPKPPAISMMTLLDHPYDPKHTVDGDFFNPFDAADYPFQVRWLNDRLSIYTREREQYFLLQSDSMSSHPEMEERINLANAFTFPLATPVKPLPTDFVRNQITTAEFETMDAALFLKEYDIFLFKALQLLPEYPHNRYIISRMGKALLDVYELKNNNMIEKGAAKYSRGYSPELQLVNNLLYNISTKELGELTYYFLSNPNYFHKDDRNSYFLLLKICELTRRLPEVKKVKEDYKAQFDEGISGYNFK